MENKNIIIILVAIIVILAAAIGFVLLNPLNSKEPCKIKITSDKKQYEGGELSIKLTDLNKTPLTKQKVGIIITDKNAKLVANKSVITDSKGKAKCDLDLKKGKYVVNVTYGGNENYTGNNTTQKLTIKEEVVEAQVSSSSSASYSEPSDWVDSNGEPHYYENGQEYVGTRDGQHMTVEMDAYVREHGME